MQFEKTKLNSNNVPLGTTTSRSLQNPDVLEAKRVLELEAKNILAACDRLNKSFSEAITLFKQAILSGGKIVVLGVGKSGKIGSKTAATLSSIGAPAVFLHPTEAAHGDLGLVRKNDAVLAISYSGNAEEILLLLPSLRAIGVKIISIVGQTNSPLANESHVVLDGSVSQEACNLNLAPTCSTTVALALGDALAIVLSKHLGFKEELFALNHPAGILGRRLTLHVLDLMKKDNELPWVNTESTLEEVVNTATEKKLGAVLVCEKPTPQKIAGLITDGDIRRALRQARGQGQRFFELRAKDIMTVNPVCIKSEEKAIRALELMENRSSQINVLPVLDPAGKCVGLVRLHDLIGRV